MDKQSYIVICKDADGNLQVELLSMRILESRLNTNYYGQVTCFYTAPDSAVNWKMDTLYIFKGEVVVPQQCFTLDKS